MTEISTTTAELLPGFRDPVLDAQAGFRALLQALSRPGSIVELSGPPQAPEPLNRAVAAVCLTLLDMDTRLWSDVAAGPVPAWLAFHCGCPFTPQRAEADFALITAPRRLDGWSGFHPGTAEFPEKSASLLIQVEGFGSGRGVRLSGPGIPEPLDLKVQGLPDEFWPFFRRANAEFPLGLDVFLISPDRVCALSRTTELELN